MVCFRYKESLVTVLLTVKKIHEQVLPAKYQHLITGEINQILRELKKAPAPPVSAVDQQPQYEGSPRRPSFPILEKGTTSGSLPAGASNSPDPGAGASDAYGTLPRKASQMADDFDFPLKEYYDEDLIELIVEDTAYATKRGAEKAAEWLDKLHKQDIVTVGDLRDLQEEDWANLYVFFVRLALLTALTH